MSTTNGTAAGSGHNAVVAVDGGEGDSKRAAQTGVFGDLQEAEAHPAYDVLKGSKNWKIDAKRTILLNIARLDERTIFEEELLVPGSEVLKCMSRLKASGYNATSRKTNWNSKYVAVHLILLDKFLTKSREIKETKRNSNHTSRIVDPTPVKVLKKLLTEATEKAAAEASVASSKKKRSVIVQQKGERVQDRVPYNQNSADFEACPLCQHLICMPVDDAAVIDRQNAAIRTENENKMKE